MSDRFNKDEYIKRLKQTTDTLDFKRINNKTILLSGATGLIGTYLIDSLLSNIAYVGKIVANTTNIGAAQKRFAKWHNDPRLVFIEGDIKEPLKINEHIDIVIHAASYTDPANYAAHPIDTMLINIIGLKNMLDIAARDKAEVIVMSTTEVYGKVNNTTPIKEEDYGYIDPLEVRSAYNIAKRAAETLAMTYRAEHGISVIILRFSRVYGPTMRQSDTKALAQFIKNALNGEDVVLKSVGDQVFSYLYVSDAVSAMFHLLASGKDGEAYNVTHEESKTLKEIALLVAKSGNVNFTQIINDDYDGKGYSKAMYAILDIQKLKDTGFVARVGLDEGIRETLSILKVKAS